MRYGASAQGVRVSNSTLTPCSAVEILELWTFITCESCRDLSDRNLFRFDDDILISIESNLEMLAETPLPDTHLLAMRWSS